MSHKFFRLLFVPILVIGSIVTPALQEVRAAGPWYVATSGDDNNDCLGPTTPCATINGAIGKAASGETVHVTEGIYTGNGSEVVLIDRNITLSGGWDASFTTQNGMSTLNGEGMRRGILVHSDIAATLERLLVQNGFFDGAFNGGGGIRNDGELTLDQSILSHNSVINCGEGGNIYNTGVLRINNTTIENGSTVCGGGGVENSGNFTMTNSTIQDNHGVSGLDNNGGTITVVNSTVSGTTGSGVGINSFGGGIVSVTESNISNNTGAGILVQSGSMTLRDSAVDHNSGGGIYVGTGASVEVSNSTDSNNGNAPSSTGGVYVESGGTLFLNSSTIAANQGTHSSAAGGITSFGTVTSQNSILSGNTGSLAPDCVGTIGSAGYNLIGSTSGCNFTPGSSDLADVDARLGSLIGSPAYHPLASDSPAIDAGDPACPSVDQRGMLRPQGSACDIGAYEYVASPGPASVFGYVSGSNQRTSTGFAFPIPFAVYALDSDGSAVPGVTVTFTAPASGPSGTFGDSGTNITTALSDSGGTAMAPTFTANGQAGGYTVSASAAGLGSIDFNLEQADRPGNDNFENAEELPSLPFSALAELGEATVEPGEPQVCTLMDRTIWYAFIPSETTTFRADALGGIHAGVNIFRADASGIAGLQFLRCAGPGEAVTFPAEAGQKYYMQIGAPFDATGTVQFNVSKALTISGRVTDALTGAPLPGFVSVTLLYSCGAGCLEFISAQNPDSEGRFLFDNYVGRPLPGGSYQIEVFADSYRTQQFGPFELSNVDLDVGELLMDSVPQLGSISGRLVDAATGKPLSPLFPSTVELLRCMDGNCFESLGLRIPGSQGEFRFETDNIGNPLPAGTYQIRAIADQYHNYQTELFEVGEGAHQSIGNLRITSFPVRFSNVQQCADLPASGGECAFSVRIWNGLSTKFKGSTWSRVGAQVPDSFISFTNFQVKAPQKLELDKGKSKIVRFRLGVPGSSSQFPAFICPNVFVGQGNNFLFNPVGFKDLFCIFRNSSGFSTAAPPQTMAEVETDTTAASTATETEPNNSCQTAQDVGAVPSTLVLDGNLDSTLEPDIDFYRFSGTPGTPIIIDYEGQATGKGTLDNPLLAFFDSDCNLITLTDDSSTENSRLEIPIPANGSFILGATAHPDFGLSGGGNGSYQLTVTTVPVIASIRGRITGISGTPLRGDVDPFAVVYLLHCSDFDCGFANSQATDSEGRFSFESDSNGTLLRAGDYKVVATANQYLEGQLGPFTVGEAQDHDIGDLALASFPVVFSDIQPCHLPATGGICNFSVKITNGLSTRLSGKAWTIVNGSELGSFISFTTFQINTVRDVNLRPGRSTTLRFQLRVPDSVADGSTICPVIHVGKNPNAYFHPEGVSLLFCLTKGAEGIALLSPQAAQSASQQMQLQRRVPPGLLTEGTR